MKKLGLIGGIGPESTIPYYREIVFGVQKRVGRPFFPNISSSSGPWKGMPPSGSGSSFLKEIEEALAYKVWFYETAEKAGTCVLSGKF